MIKRLHLWILAVVLTSCTDYIDNPVVTDDKPFSYDLYMDKSVRPGDDFFRYACGKWIDDTSIPSLSDQATQKMVEVTDQLLVKSQDPTVSAMRQLVLAARADDSADFLVLKSRIDYLSAISTQEELLAAFTQLQQWGYTPLVRLSTTDNDGVIIPLITSERPSMYLHYAMAYNDLDMLTNYAWDLCENLRNFGFTEERITEIHKNAMVIEEKEMYIYDDSNANQITRPRPQPLPLTRSDDDAYYRKIFRELMGIGDLADQAMISNGEILSFFDYLLDGSDEAIAVLRDYMIFYVLGQDFVFVRRMEPDYGELTRLDEAMKFATYHMYRLLVEARGEEIHKERCREIMEDIRTILIERIDRLDWMSSATKQEAKKKARQMKFLIGYPDQWSDEFTPVIKETTLLEAVTSLRRQSVEWIHKIAGQSTQTRAWDYYCMNHRFSLVNAWYEKAYNQLWITPAYIMAPLFDQEQNEATLYATAYVFAHEISHGFGGGGSYYDEVGNYRDWWTAEDRTAFEQKQQQMITLYNQLEAYPGQPANGEKTLNENMADLGGVTLALEAYKRRLKKQGFSGEQLDEQLRKFWLSYVMVIGADYYERNLDMLKWNYLHDSHSAGHNRINGIARLIDDWYRLYDVKPTDKLYLAPEDRVKIW